MKQTIIDVFRFQRGYLDLLLDGIPERRYTDQPAGVANHPAWQLGHLGVVYEAFGRSLGLAASLPEQWGAMFGAGSQPVADAAAYPPPAELLRSFDHARSRFEEAYRSAGESALDGENPMEILRFGLPTLGHFIVFGMLTHEATHLGQLAVWRKAAGLPEALAAFRARHAEPQGA